MDIDKDFLQIISVFLANFGLIAWFRAESRSDWRHIDSKIEAHQKDTTQIIKAIQAETRDFHAKLYALECSNRKRK